ncbi:hypothetical protein FP435_07255 [Lactobacillus sp. PV037]|uniref:hypothetical protein n=1 Tax=Lactobacillus sp. PV037 TaxID=2594496 RepID=UPI002240A37E|nr:hypothetical protein [Lactobacillus sp. PV037]QNQ84227.1 hypothetical protein FP435_07255 [Lactobacillus sp. PV037]
MATEAQKRARNKWNAKNKEKAKKYSYKSMAKNFIINYAQSKDLEDLEDFIKQRKEVLKEEVK